MSEISSALIASIRSHMAQADRTFYAINPTHIVSTFARLEASMGTSPVEIFGRKHATLIVWYQKYCTNMLMKCGHENDWDTLRNHIAVLIESSPVIALNVATLLYVKPASVFIPVDYHRLYHKTMAMVLEQFDQKTAGTLLQGMTDPLSES